MASNVIPFPPRAANDNGRDPPPFAPGVVPFDYSNPVHIRAWNTIFALGWAEKRAEGRL